MSEISTSTEPARKIRVAIVGTGNCASSLYQGIHYYGRDAHDPSSTETKGSTSTSTSKSGNGLMSNFIGGYHCGDIEVVCAFDIDRRKVGRSLKDALLYAKPNCTPIYFEDVPAGPIVQMGPVLDGVASVMNNFPDDQAFRVKVNESGETEAPVDVVQVLKDRNVDILINYLPVGSQKATEYYANCCLEANVALCNCIPVFIASNPKWEQKFIDAGLPLIGDDMKSQFGASILSQMLQELAFARGHKVKCHIQRNVGGNTDFLNMIDQTRLKSKKISKENVIRAQNRIRDVDTSESFLHAGPSEYISYHKDNKIANFHLELEGFMGAPVVFDAQLSVMDSPNSAGVVIDAVRYLKVAREMGLVGALRGPSAFTQKTPPQQLPFEKTTFECNSLANRELTEMTKVQQTKYDAVEYAQKMPSYNTAL